ncbi:MAG: tyrosine-type recombinase/integrase [Casimicrobiaceae bacterium]
MEHSTDAKAVEKLWDGAIPRRKPLKTHRECETARDGRNPVANCADLWLVVRGENRSWTLIYKSPATGKRREVGLGKFPNRGLKAAKDEAERIRVDVLRKGVDPQALKEQARADETAAKAQRKAAGSNGASTWRRRIRHYHEEFIEPERSDKHSAQWISSIEQHVPAKLLDRPDTVPIEWKELCAAIQPIYLTETGRRVLQRLDKVFSHAVRWGVTPANPVPAVRSEFKDTIKKKRVRTSFRALPYGDVPALVQRLRKLPGTAARALEFALLCAARTGEVLFMEWTELSRDGTTWTVPASRMKAGEAHDVFLSDAARAVLDQVRGGSERWCFRSPVRDAPLSNMAMLTLLRRLEISDKTTVHGVCRSTFSTWANETGAARSDVIEAALAHQEGDRVRRAYNRAEFIDERRKLLDAWARFVAPMPTSCKTANVVPFNKRVR